MASFNYGGAGSIARDPQGLTKLKNNLSNDIKRAQKHIKNSSEYNKFINTVRKNWSGPDAEAFLKSFKKDVEDAKQAMVRKGNKLVKALDEDLVRFNKMQQKNANTIK